MSTIDEVKSRVDIVDFISEHVALQRAGRNLRGLCPFHTEKTPSFYVSPERQTWHCFGACGTGGDCFTFLMKKENLEFREALQTLAQRAGVTLDNRRPPEEEERHRRLYEANEAAATFYANALASSAGGGTRRYLATRGLDEPTIEAFQLGYSPDAWETLKSHLLGRGFSAAELLTAGLLVEGERGTYDRFRGRLMFPIRDDRGRVAGFGSRALEGAPDAQGAKYINTPRSPIFDKSDLLYALDRAKEAIRQERSVIVVEGYMDAIAAHQHGLRNVVASMGTALTERQIRAVERLKGKILLAMDADAAGIAATLRGLQEAEAVGAIHAGGQSVHPSELGDEAFSEKVQEWSRDALRRAAVNFFVVPLSGKDPDEMIRADRPAWEAAIANAVPFTDHVFETLAGRKDLTQPAQRSELLQELLPVVRLIEEPVYQAHYVQRLARLAQVTEQTVRAELRRGPARPARRAAAVPPPASTPRGDALEEFLLALLLHHEFLRPEGEGLSADLFVHEEHRALFGAWRAGAGAHDARDALPDELHPVFDRMMAKRLPVLEGARLQEAFWDCVRRIGLRRLSQAKQASASALAERTVHEEDVRAAVEQAQATWQAGTESTQAAAGDAAPSELAVALIEDMEAGRRLHQTPQHAPAEPSAAPSPQG